MKHKTGDEWYPFWIDKWLFGSTKFEFTPAERSVWIDLLTLAHKDKGYIRANENMPYPPEHLANLFVVPVDLLQSTIKKSIENGKLQKLEDGSLFVVSYEKYELSGRHKKRFGEEFKPEYERFLPCPPKFIDMSTKKGYVRRSRLIVAISLKRSLSKEEEVHHIKKEDDRPENLMLFSCHKDHLQYQSGYAIKPIWDGSKLTPAAINDIMTELAAQSAAINDTKSREEESRIENTYSQEFESFWSLYPKKVGKGEAFRSWRKLNPDILMRGKIKSAVEQQKTSKDWLKDNGQFIPNPATWLNQRRFDDTGIVKPKENEVSCCICGKHATSKQNTDKGLVGWCSPKHYEQWLKKS